MEVAKETLAQLGKEGIKKVEGLAKFSKEIWKQVAENLKHPGGRMKNPDKEKDEKSPATVPQTLYLFGKRQQKSLLEASGLTRYYETVGCHLTVSNTVYETIIKSFTNQWAGLKDCTCQSQLSMRDKFLHEKVWNGQSLSPLEMFIGQHRGAFIAMKEAAEHVTF
eukprot:12123999-Ditylum_brightwellii.AAC.1